ncbi:Transposable element Tc3 transposase [Araneus ventricosus]|uniref:Transposable element Tc3 transposase n=1 Tax=Araneus ventricosus TaxID=182803 RepID=A0A4Y2L1K1_ARAVE|nr:Transposable element Tc3 transposase [Araneus ventricosus]
MARRSPLSKLHFCKRLQWARNHMSYGDKWMADLISDEKNGTSMDLTGLYNIGMIYDKSPGAFSVGKVVVDLSAFSFSGQVGLAFLDGRQNSPKYIETLENHIMPFAENKGRRNREYQDDTNTSNATKNYLNSKNVTVLEWTPMSPDLNPIENVWDFMPRKVYDNGGQFYSVNDLKTAIESAWYNSEPEILQTLIMLMEKRAYDVILKSVKTLNH